MVNLVVYASQLPQRAPTCGHAGINHEIYLSDPGRTPADRIRTMIRRPVEPVEPAA